MSDTRVDGTKFWAWFDALSAKAKASPVGEVMTKAGYEPYHTGGGCTAWSRLDEGKKVQVMICDEANGLGDRVDEEYLVGLHSVDGEHFVEGAVVDLATAVEWCNECMAALDIARKWVARLGGGFHPDTSGKSYVKIGTGGERFFTDEEAEEYEQDIEKLFKAPCDPYGVAIMAIAEART